MSDWDGWIGRSEVREDRVDAGLVERFCATLDAAPTDGLAPQGLHWCLCPPEAPTARLGPDGHPVRDDAGLLPPIPLPRRMWAASRVAFVAPLRVGERVRRTSRVASVEEKRGGSGLLVFVEVEHVVEGDSGPAVREMQTIVYREAAPAGAPPSPPLRGAARFAAEGFDAHRLVMPEPPLLFRYSALTFNSHRIHYDLPYACEQEGYRGLVVHGPLTATLLLDLARRTWGDEALASFAFRGVSPAVAGEPLHLTLRAEGETVTLGAWAGDGTAVMSATGVRKIR